MLCCVTLIWFPIIEVHSYISSTCQWPFSFLPYDGRRFWHFSLLWNNLPKSKQACLLWCLVCRLTSGYTIFVAIRCDMILIVLKFTHHNRISLKLKLFKGNQGKCILELNTSIIENQYNFKFIHKFITKSQNKCKNKANKKWGIKQLIIAKKVFFLL